MVSHKANVDVTLGEKGAIEVDDVGGLGMVQSLELQQDPLPHLAVDIQLDDLEGHQLSRHRVPHLLHNPAAASPDVVQEFQIFQLDVILRLEK